MGGGGGWLGGRGQLCGSTFQLSGFELFTQMTKRESAWVQFISIQFKMGSISALGKAHTRPSPVSRTFSQNSTFNAAPMSVPFSWWLVNCHFAYRSVQYGIYVLGKAHMHYNLSLRN